MSVTAESQIVIVGASLAGLRCAEALRRLGHAGPIVLVGSESHLPYDRPPLSKEVLVGAKTLDDTALTDSVKMSELGIDLMLGHAAEGLDLDTSEIRVGPEKISFDGLVVATGSHPRRFPGVSDLRGVHVIRTRDDAASLRDDLIDAGDVVVIGGGFIGAEAAASARSLGCEVTVLEAAAAPMARGLGEEMGTVCGLLHADNGTDLRVGVGVAGVRGESGRVHSVELSDGTELHADVVVVGIGTVPSVAWLEGSGLGLDNGVLCDEYLCASPKGAKAAVYAAGDIAVWPNQWNGEVMRVEHWTNAVEQSFTVAKNLLVEPQDRVAHSSVPFVWSDQYGHRIQIAGRPHGDDEVHIVAGSVADRSLVAAYRRGDALTGVMAIDMIKPFVTGRRLLMKNASWAETVETYSA